jgi:predicted enzyme related to lactoylglutathione lyase
MSQSNAANLVKGTIVGIDLAALLVSDPQRSIAFYRDVLGMTPTAEQARGAEFTLPDGTTFGVWRDENATSGSVMMFAVDDIDEAVARFRKNGATLTDPVETLVCHMAFGKDPDGNGFVIHKRKVRD